MKGLVRRKRLRDRLKELYGEKYISLDGLLLASKLAILSPYKPTPLTKLEGFDLEYLDDNSHYHRNSVYLIRFKKNRRKQLPLKTLTTIRLQFSYDRLLYIYVGQGNNVSGVKCECADMIDIRTLFQR